MAGFTFDKGAEIEESEIEESVNITISVFFDGTQNNMKNTEAKMEFIKKQEFDNTPSFWAADTTVEQKNKVRAKHYDLKKVEYYEKYGNKDDDSYENDLTNVARLFKFYEIEESNPEDLRACIYIEGIGTSEYKSDQVFPAVAFGWSSPVNGSGVLDKVKMGCEQTVKKIDGLRKGKNIKKLTIDVFGFSRGAAAARNFVYEITQAAKPAFTKVYSATGGIPVMVNFPEQPKYGPIGAYLEKNEVEYDIFEVRFAGLYDTVSSFGKKKSDDVRELNLDAIKNALHTLHLAAEDEHRENFPLITIASSVNSGKGKEIYLPGVHSDIGGSYVDNAVETKDELINGSHAELLEEKSKLIAEGWYKDPELSISKFNPKSLLKTYMNVSVFDYTISGKLTGTRKLSNKYSFIGLYIMCDYAMLPSIKMKFKKGSLKGKFTIPASAEHKELKDIEKILMDYVFKNGRKPTFHTRKELEAMIHKVRPATSNTFEYDFKFKSTTDHTAVAPSNTSIYQQQLAKESYPLNPSEFSDHPELKQKIEDYYLLSKIRNKYLHWSSNFDWIGMNPNYDVATKNRKRVKYDG